MANFYLDNKDLQIQFDHPLMRRIIELREGDFSACKHYDYAPQNAEDALDSYRRVMELAGEICGEVIAANAEGVDREGPHHEVDRVEYASGTKKNLQAMQAAGLDGMSLPRQYGGLNLPLTASIMTNEMIARGDAGFQNVWGLQDCAETLNEFGSEAQKQEYLTRTVEGATWSMSLTEPDAGSDLGAAMLKASWSEERNTWLLNGVKRFITNGDGD
ncbi:MAG: acyl-CoA dehydrogenase family protein, partial [Alistipes sp.]|nr:acyl-CoA dehydrogenase family protein [Alistipes sp.]